MGELHGSPNDPDPPFSKALSVLSKSDVKGSLLVAPKAFTSTPICVGLGRSQAGVSEEFVEDGDQPPIASGLFQPKGSIGASKMDPDPADPLKDIRSLGAAGGGGSFHGCSFDVSVGGMSLGGASSAE